MKKTICAVCKKDCSPVLIVDGKKAFCSAKCFEKGKVKP
jgi:copper oxidase (laccase) domain-containing protein